MKRKILIVEDDADLARGLDFNLGHEGYEVETAGALSAARAAIAKRRPDLVILDLSLPDGDGLDLLEDLRKAGDAVPVLCLTARAQETDVVMGLGIGADDYVAKPFGLAELLARVEALLRRAGRAPGREVRFGDVTVDLTAHRVDRGGTREDLTPIEADLLAYLLRRRGEAIPREELLKDLWGVSSRHDTRTLDNHVARLRKKIEADPAAPRFLVTVHGIGYRLEPDAGTS